MINRVSTERIENATHMTHYSIPRSKIDVVPSTYIRDISLLYCYKSPKTTLEDVFVAKLNHMSVQFKRKNAALVFIRNNKNQVSSLKFKKYMHMKIGSSFRFF